MARADSYLTIPPGFADRTGFQWSFGCDAVELESGPAVVLADELAELLAGVFADRPPHFGHVLLAYHRLKTGGDGFDPASAVFHKVRLVPGAVRSAGRLIAHLCRGLPPAPDPPTWDEVSLGLARLQQTGERRRPHLAVEPSLSALDFTAHLRREFAGLSADALAHWLKYGGPATTAGRPLAAGVEDLPARVAKALALGKARLAGAARLVPLLDAALTLPPRRRRADSVPQGGYADVTTRGQPDQLLPSQLALDPDEFVRRFAERELLFFQREEPHTPKPAGRVIVLDQGVRTWGLVRHGLTAAAAVLLGKDPKRAGVARLTLTAGDPLDLDASSPGELATRLAASDLSVTPATAVRFALADADDGPRDVVLLTHPRSAADPTVRAAVATAGPDDRVFALTLDDAGAAELVEWRPGGPVTVRGFRVDLRDPPPPKPVEVVRTDPGEWAGDRERFGFLFRPGVVGEVAMCGLDAAGGRLVAVTREGVPQVLTVGDTAPEVLPRAARDGAVLRQVEAVLGVSGGVVLCGRMTLAEPSWFVTVQPSNRILAAHATDAPPPAGPPSDRLVAAHYDFTGRTVRLHDLGAMDSPVVWDAFPDLHCISVRRRNDPDTGSALNLGSGERSSGSADPNGSRVATAWERAVGTPCSLGWMRSETATPSAVTRPTLLVAAHELGVVGAERVWDWFAPQQDGKPLFDARNLDYGHAVLAGDVLAVQRMEAGRGEKLHLYRGPKGVAVRTVPLGGGRGRFALNADGRRLGLYYGTSGTLTLYDTDDVGGTRAAAHRAKLHTGLVVQIAGRLLIVRVGGYLHQFDLDPGRSFSHVLGPALTKLPDPTGTPGGYDRQRFRSIGQFTEQLAVWADQLGQVLLATADGDVRAAVLVRRDKAAAWGRGGAFWGDPTLIGGPPTPDAARCIAEAVDGTA